MADVSSPCSTLPGYTSSAPANAVCDEHHDLCDECANAMQKEIQSDREGICDWCKTKATDLRYFRDYEEGLYGRVYRVCGACVKREIGGGWL